jgi:hypothetical protein
MSAAMTGSKFFKRLENAPQGDERKPDKGAFKEHTPAPTQSLLSESFKGKTLE